MTRLLRAAASLFLLTAATTSFAFVRSTTRTDQPPQPPLDLWWRPRQIVFQVNASGYTGAGCSGAAEAAAQIRASLPAWMNATRAGQTQACTDFKFNDCGDTTRTDLGFDRNNPSTNVNLIVIRKGNCSAVSDSICHVSVVDLDPCIEKYNCWEDADTQGHADPRTLALTTVTFDQNSGEIFDADMELNGWNGSLTAPTGEYFTCAPPGSGTCVNPFGDASCIQFDVSNTATHEAGHMLGLDHSLDTTATMAATASPGATDKRTLAADDINGVCSIYPVGAPTVLASGASPNGGTATGTMAIASPQACPSGSPSSSSNGGGCSAGGGGIASLIALALWRRRARVGRGSDVG